MSKRKVTNYANRGMLFETIIENTNKYYYNEGMALIKKIPTPIKMIGYDKGGMIKGFWEKKSTLDFNGVIQNGTHIDFDTKETKSTTSFPLGNISEHQMKYARDIEKFGGITFFLISIRNTSEVYLLTFYELDRYLEKYPNKKSIPFSYFEEELKEYKVKHKLKNGVLIYDYLETLYLLA